MRCPIHKTKFFRQAGPGRGLGLETHICKECSGLWVGLAEFKNRLPARAGGAQPPRRCPGHRPCPKCEARMETWRINAVEVDICRACKGIWFDRGELEKLAQNPKPAAMRQPSDNLHWLDLISDAPFDAGVKVLGQTIGEICEQAPEALEAAGSSVLEIIGGILSAIDF